MLSQLIARSVLAVGLFVCLSLQLLGQSSVSPEQMYHKVWAVVPMVGTGKPNDPRRPMLIPSPAEMAADQQAREASAKPDPSDSTGKRKVLSPPDLVGVSMQIGDDGKTALVEFTFLNPAAFHNFLVKAAAQQGVSVQGGGASPTVIDQDKLNRGGFSGDEVSKIEGNKVAMRNALEAAIPGVKFLERGKTTDAEIQAVFRKVKGDFDLDSRGPAPAKKGGAQ